VTLAATASSATAAQAVGRRVAVIGAGAAGLCAAKYLLARGVQVRVFEAGSHIGGLWVYDNDNGLSMAYKSLHLNSEHAVTAYRDFPFPAESPLYPRHDHVRSYLQAYAKHFDLERHIAFRSPVIGVEPLGERWRVRLAQGEAYDADAVVVASGHQSEPAHPPWKDQFTGSYLHSNVYREPEAFRDQRVLVVGMGNSAVDIAADICTVTASTTLSARSPVLVMPRMLFGVPTSRVLGKLEKRWMPWPLRRTIRELLVRIVYGRMEQWGFVTPKTRTHPTSATTLMSHFIWNRITAKPGIESVQGREVRFTDGSTASYDTVIAGTGYRVNLPFLAPELRPLEGHQLALFLRVVHPRQRSLYFAGMFNVAGGGNIRMMDDQAQWISELICGDLGLPDSAHMHAVMAQEQAFLQRNYPGSARYALELDPPFYRRQLAREFARARKLAGRGETSVGSAPATVEKGADRVAA
jgi:dimethylaniline monooxygenase (N-oxide forming)